MSAHILVVDDEALLGMLYEEMLEQQGYTTTIFQDPQEALEAFKKEPDSFDLVLSDYTMPNLTGIELVQEILKIRDDVPVVLCTGYSEDVDADMAVATGVSAFLMKPVEQQQLLNCIQEIIGKAAADNQ